MNKILPALLLALLVGCEQLRENELERGSFVEREYRNALLGFRLLVPESWTIDEPGDDDEALFCITKGTTNLCAYANDLRSVEGMQNVSEYFRHVQDKKPPDGVQVSFGEIRSGKISGEDFDALSVNVKGGGATFYQYLYAKTFEHYLLSFAITYETQDGFAEGREVLQSIRFSD